MRCVFFFFAEIITDCDASLSDFGNLILWPLGSLGKQRCSSVDMNLKGKWRDENVMKTLQLHNSLEADKMQRTTVLSKDQHTSFQLNSFTSICSNRQLDITHYQVSCSMMQEFTQTSLNNSRYVCHHSPYLSIRPLLS